jgi:hypothetical protein
MKSQGECIFKNRLVPVLVLLVLLVSLAGNVQAKPLFVSDKPSLLFVSISHPDDLSRFPVKHLPMVAYLDRGLLAGAELQAITLDPKPLPAPKTVQAFPAVVDPDPLIQGMLDQVTTDQIYTYDRQLAGELPVWVDDDWYTITSRYTYSGTPIQKATHFVGQHMQDLGLDVDYHVWNNATNPDVISEIHGLTNPDDIFIIGGHLDAVQGAPGADDNASGSVAALLAADIFSQYQWGCTMRFAFWTGEEQGLLGSADYAAYTHSLGENIVGYLNLDMIAWNTDSSAPGIDLLYNPTMPLTLDLANLYADVVDAYHITLEPQLLIALGGGSDHSSFWNYGYTAILGIEDQNDFNPYYHSYQDTPVHTNPAYFTDFVRASIATYAHMSNCLIPNGTGALDGQVTAAGGGETIEGAKVVANDGQGHNYPTITDPSGYYTMTLLAGEYTVSTSLDGYFPQSQPAVVIKGEITTQDFALQPICDPASGVDFSWLPIAPFSGGLVTLTAIASGSPALDFNWDFGDTYTGTGGTVIHSFLAGSYVVALSASNACGVDSAIHEIIVQPSFMGFYLPSVRK